ncbi:MAG: PAS domain-containing protein [Ahniella sp.]|nr:PAS domain-containing protein [Ahniella sp.]
MSDTTEVPVFVLGQGAEARCAELGLTALKIDPEQPEVPPGGVYLFDIDTWIALASLRRRFRLDRHAVIVFATESGHARCADLAQAIDGVCPHLVTPMCSPEWIRALVAGQQRYCREVLHVGESIDLLRLKNAVSLGRLNAWAINLETGEHLPGNLDEELFGEPIHNAADMLRGMAAEDAWIIDAIENLGRGSKHGDSMSHEFRRIDRTGLERWYATHASCHQDPERHSRGVIGVTYEISDRKRAELTAERHAGQLSTTLRAAGMVSWEYDALTNRRHSVGDDFALFGCSPTSLEEVEALVLPEDRHGDRFLAYRQALVNGEAFMMEFRVRRADGSVRWLQTRGRPELAADGTLLRATGIAFDITERKQIEMRLAETEAWLRRALNAGRMVAWEWNLRERTRRIFGQHDTTLGPESGGTSDPRAALHPTDRERDEHLFDAAVAHGQDYANEFRVVADDGSVRWLRSVGSPSARDAEGVISMTGLAWDISDRKEMELTLRETENRLRRTLGSGQMVIWEWNLRTHQRRSFGDKLELLGAGHEDIDAAWARLHPDDLTSFRTQFELAVREAREFRAEFRLLAEDGTATWVRSIGAPLAFDREGVAVMGGVSWDISERKRAELALIESENRLRSALDAARMVSWEWNLLTGKREAIGDQHAMFGFVPGVDSADIDGAIDPTDYALDNERFETAIRERTPYASEFRIRTHDDRVRWLYSRGKVTAERNGEAEIIAGVVWDITDRKDIEAALSIRESELSTALQAARMCRFQYDYQNRQWLLSDDASAVFGTRLGQISVHADSVKDLTRYLARLHRGLPVEDVEIKLQAGSTTPWVELRANLLERNRANGLFWDISLRKTFEEALLESENWHRIAVEGANLNVWEYDLETKIRRGGNRDLEFFGMVPDSLEALLEVVHEDDREGLTASFFESVTVSGVQRQQFRVRKTDGGYRWIESIGRVLTRRDGSPWRYAGVSLDITEKKEHADALQRAVLAAEHAVRAQSSFLAAMSHEIRTPMNAVIGMTGLLLTSPLDERQQDMARTLRSSAELLLNLINDVLDFSKIDAGQMELDRIPFSLAEVIESSIDLLAPQAEAKHLSLGAVFDFDIGVRVLGDPARLRQILVNLLSNAIKFTPTGHVEIKASLWAQPGGAARLWISVRDQGIGIASDVLDTLFTPFRQGDSSMSRRFGGTGLGLVICKRLADLMEGEISVESEPGRGACFKLRIDLPIVDNEPGAPVWLAGQRIAVVMDEGHARDALIEQLVLFGASVAHHPDFSGIRPQAPPAAVIADADMRIPQGFEWPTLHVLGLGAMVRDGHPTLSRPIRPSVLLDRLAHLIREPKDLPGTTAPTELETSSAPFVPLRILVAEDNDVNQMLIELMLQSLGHEIVLVADGEAVLEALATEPFNVILMDVEMPGVDGLEATRRLRAMPEYQQLPYIIAATAHVMSDSRQRFLEAGMNDYVPKPILMPELKASLDRAAEYLANAGMNSELILSDLRAAGLMQH